MSCLTFMLSLYSIFNVLRNSCKRIGFVSRMLQNLLKMCNFTCPENKHTQKTRYAYISEYLTLHYYSVKIFPRFWLAKSTCIIHHNQLPMTKKVFEKKKWKNFAINDVKRTASLQVNASLTEKTRGGGWVVSVVKTKMADISLVSRVRTRRNNS